MESQTLWLARMEKHGWRIRHVHAGKDYETGANVVFVTTYRVTLVGVNVCWYQEN